jgi:hypothetical protein
MCLRRFDTARIVARTATEYPNIANVFKLGYSQIVIQTRVVTIGKLFIVRID